MASRRRDAASRATTDADGRLAVRGFCGSYRLTASVAGGKIEQRFRVAKGVGKEAVITPAP